MNLSSLHEKVMEFYEEIQQRNTFIHPNFFLSQTMCTEYQPMKYENSVKNCVRAEFCFVRRFGFRFFESSLLSSWVLLILLYFHLIFDLKTLS